MTSTRLAGPQAKIARAIVHIESLRRLEKEFWEKTSSRYEFFEEFDEELDSRCLKVRLQGRIDDEFYLIAGEAIYQLRSALDQTAIEMARRTTPAPSLKGIYFPSGKTKDDYEKNISTRLKGVDAKLQQAVKTLAVFNGGNTALYSVFPLANIDKHMTLLAVGQLGHISHASDMHIVGDEVALYVGGKGDLGRGIVFFVLGAEGVVHNPGTLKLAGKIVLGEAGDYDGRPLIELLEEMASATRSAIRRMRSAMSAGGF